MKMTITLAVLAVMIVAVMALSNDTNTLAGKVTVDAGILGAQNELTNQAVNIKNVGDSDWHNVRITITDVNGREYNCPNMLILNQGAQATIQNSYCFNDANAPLRTPVSKVKITADEGEATFAY